MDSDVNLRFVISGLSSDVMIVNGTDITFLLMLNSITRDIVWAKQYPSLSGKGVFRMVKFSSGNYSRIAVVSSSSPFYIMVIDSSNGTTMSVYK